MAKIDNRHELSGSLTRDQLMELEREDRSSGRLLADRIKMFLPVPAGCVALAEYLLVPNIRDYQSTPLYSYFLAVLIALCLGAFISGLLSRRAEDAVLHRAPFWAFVFFLLAGYDLLTLKSGILMMPYFPWVDAIMTAGWSDRAFLIECAGSSLFLLFSGYSVGALVGLVIGVGCGYSRRVDYWLSPFLKLMGAIPSATWIPVVMVIAASLFAGSVFIISLGVCFAVSTATMNGIRNIDRSYFDAARTLGARPVHLVLRVAVPFALPSVLQGLTQGMSSACMALIIAEMVGVESGLGWYVSWQRSWAQYGKMYAAIIVLCVVFIAVNFALARIRRRLLRWQEGMVR